MSLSGFRPAHFLRLILHMYCSTLYLFVLIYSSCKGKLLVCKVTAVKKKSRAASVNASIAIS